MMRNKLGPYINKLMTTIVDKDGDEFVKELAFNELKRLNVDIEEFLRKNTESDDEEREKTEKQLLTETEEK
tara:strand:+ start:353 stop:565 length:213 start_codon:yes stop_codon:yes gene_type:complete